MRIQIIDLPSQQQADGSIASPYLLVMSEMRHEARPDVASFRKDGFDHCAGVIATTDVVHIGEESLYELQQRETMSLLTAEANLGLPYGSIIRISPGGPVIAATDVGLMDGTLPRGDQQDSAECPEHAEGRGCVCSLGAQDCPVNGNVPRSIGVMDIAPESRAVSVTENEGGVRVAHIAIDVDQTPEELGSDVAAIVEEQRGEREYRQIGFCSCRIPGQYEKTCGIPAHRGEAIDPMSAYANPTSPAF